MAFNTEELENLSALMLATDNTNTRLAFEILDAQPETEFPKELITEIFVVFKMSNHEDYQAKAGKILYQHASPAIHRVMQRKFDLGEGTAVEATIAKNITKYIAGTELNGLKFARALYNKYGRGIVYLLEKLPNTELKKFLEQFINGTSFSLINKDLTTLPKVFFELTQLTEIDLAGNKLGTIYAQFKNFTKLKKLNISNNNVKAIPKDIAKLTQLEYLNISNNAFPDFPTVITELKNLNYLNISGFESWGAKNMMLPDAFFELPKMRHLYLHESGRPPFRNYPMFVEIVSDDDKPLNLKPLEAAKTAFRQRKEGVSYLLEFADTTTIQEVIGHFYDATTKTLNLKNVPILYLPKELLEWDIQHLILHDSGLGYRNLWSYRDTHEVLENLIYVSQLKTLNLKGNRFKDWPAALFKLHNLELLGISFSDEDLEEALAKSLPNCKIEKGW